MRPMCCSNASETATFVQIEVVSTIAFDRSGPEKQAMSDLFQKIRSVRVL
jgi:hypothetical protein